MVNPMDAQTKIRLLVGSLMIEKIGLESQVEALEAERREAMMQQPQPEAGEPQP